jgi:hypothetical protein
MSTSKGEKEGEQLRDMIAEGATGGLIKTFGETSCHATDFLEG